jgi:SAM-dependent methyltransferase
MTDTEAEFVSATREFYDAVAEDYAERFRGDLAAKPLDRGILTAYAELVAGGEVADLGCGPGRVTGQLAGLGLSVFGLDLSEAMLTIARRENPGLRFERGSMTALDVPDGTLTGVVSWYSSIHTSVEQLPALFAEFARVLLPAGHLLLAFQVGDRPRHLDRPFGHPVSLDFLRRQPDEMAELLEEAGFELRAQLVREPDEGIGESTRQAFLIARKRRVSEAPAAR